MERLSLWLVTSAFPWIHVSAADQFASSRKYAGPHSICQQYCHKCREHSETLARTPDQRDVRMSRIVLQWYRGFEFRMELGCVHVFTSFVTGTVMGRTPNKEFWKMSKVYVSRRIHFESERPRGRGSRIIRPLIRPMYTVRDSFSMLHRFLNDTVWASQVIHFPMERGERTGGKAVVAYYICICFKVTCH